MNEEELIQALVDSGRGSGNGPEDVAELIEVEEPKNE